MLLDHVLHPPTRAVELFVEVLCPAAGDVGDDEPGLDADTASGFDASDDPAFLAPTPGGVIGLEKAAYAVLVMDRRRVAASSVHGAARALRRALVGRPRT